MLESCMRPALAVALVVGLAPAASAQTGMIKGKVIDAEDKPVAGRADRDRVRRRREPQVRGQDRSPRRVHPDRPAARQLQGDGDGRQAGHADADAPRPRRQAGGVQLRVRPGRRRRRPGGRGQGGGTEEDCSRKAWPPARPTITTSPSRSSTAAAAAMPTCYDCYYNIGFAYSQKKDEKQAEAAWLKALEMKADYAEALNALATLYNNQKRFDEAAAMGAKAASAGGGGRQRRRGLQPGHHPLEPGQDSRGQGEVRGSAQGQPEPCGVELPDGHGAAQRRQAAGSHRVVREVSAARARRPVRRAGEGMLAQLKK